VADDPPVWRLVFEERPGLVVRVSIPTLEARALAVELVPDFTSEDEAVVVAAVARLAVPFGDSLVSWTARTPAGDPAPPTRKGTVRVDVWLLLDVLREWIPLWPPLGGTPPVEVEPDAELALLAGMPMVPLADEEVGDELAELEAVS